MSSLLVPPATVHGMTHLDRSKFTTVVEVPCLKIGDIKLAKIIPTLKRYILKIPNLKPIQDTESGKLVYLDPEKVKTFESIASADRHLLTLDRIEKLEKTPLTLKYDNWQSEEILKAVLPQGIEVPTSYSMIGHIVHLNLRENQLPYQKLIGQVFLDKISHARTVVNKVNTIDTTFRHFTMEILAGHDDTIVTVKENGYVYKFDFSSVYWNPRLSTEHKTLVSFLKRGDVLYDVFAGVGPFAIPAACKGITVLANDLNPESYKWLCKNASINKTKDNLKAINKDGRDFLQNDVKADLLKRRGENTSGSEHIVMNLPALATEFLDVFLNWFTEEEIKTVSSRPPTIHVYCFVKVDKGDNPCDFAKSLVEEKLGHALSSESLVTIRYVRNVSPYKEMMRVSFLLTESILRGEEPATKKAKIMNHIDLPIDNNVVGNNGKEQRIAQNEKCIQGGRNS